MIRIRISGEQAQLTKIVALLRGLESFQATGEIQDVLRESKLRILETSEPYKNRGDSLIYRQYIEVVIDGI